MLNDLPKKQKEKKPLTKWRYFWRIQGECALRAVSPFMMYLFTSLIGLACQAFSPDTTEWYEVLLGILCIVAGAAFNAHLIYHRGILHAVYAGSGYGVCGEYDRYRKRLLDDFQV